MSKESGGGDEDDPRRIEEADRRIHEYRESKLVDDHGAQDEAERLGITGSKVEVVPEPPIEAEPVVADSPSAHQGAVGGGIVEPAACESEHPRNPCNGVS